MHKKNRIYQIILCLFFAVLCMLIVFPFLLIISASLSNAEALSVKGYQILPNPVDFTAYRYVFKNPEKILRGYGVTITYSIITMVLSTLLMSMIAYPLTRNSLKGRRGINFYLYFTMLFGGGLVPTYIITTKVLHLDNTIWVYILPALINPWYVFMLRTFFKGIPSEIIESAKIDGASEYGIFFKMILPLSKPVIATIALFMFLASWNDWNTALLYITDERLFSLQYLLQAMMENINMLKQNQQAASMTNISDVPSETVRMAMAIIAAGPALVVFPFFQKYFVKGLTVGSVKG